MNVKSFDEFINESTIKPDSIVYKKTKRDGRNTMALKVDADVYNEKLAGLFDDNGNPLPNSPMSRYEYDGMAWSIHAQEYKTNRGVSYNIYGRSGDYTFGMSPTYFKSQFGGNIKAAEKIFGIIVDKYLS